MKKLIVLSLSLLFVINAFSQYIEGNESRMGWENWFVKTRIFPNKQFPRFAYSKGMQKRDSLRVVNGYYLRHDSPVGWISIGPTPANFTCNYNFGNVGGRHSVVKFDPENSNVFWTGAACGGLWQSNDYGDTWTPLTDNLKSLSCGDLAIDDENNIMYLGTGEFTYFAYNYYGYGLYKSNDGGTTWNLIRNNLPFPCYISSIAIKPNEKNVILMGVGSNYANLSYGSGIYRSTDYGENWDLVVSKVCTDIEFSPDGSKAYAIGPPDPGSGNEWERGVGYRISTNGGANFSNDLGFSYSRAKVTVCSDSPNDRVYILTHDNDYVYLKMSTNAGYNFTTTWQGSTTDIAEQGQPYYNMCLKVHPDNPDLVYWGVSGLNRSTNSGTNFSKIGGYSTAVHPDFHDIDLISNDENKLIVACDGGVYYSTNQGTNWDNLNARLTTVQTYRIATDPEDPENIFAGCQDNALQKKYGNYSHEWYCAAPSIGDYSTVEFNPLNSNYVFADNANGHILYLSTNNGSSFDSYFSYQMDDEAWIPPIAFDVNSENVVYTSVKQSSVFEIFKSTNYGINWNVIDNNWPNQAAKNIEVNKVNSDVLYASWGSYRFANLTGQYDQSFMKSTDGGQNWTNLNIMPSQIEKRFITSIKADPNNEENVYMSVAGFEEGHIWKSTNYGSNWTDISSNLPDIPVNDLIVFYYGRDLNIIAASDMGVFISTNDGSSWLEVADGLPNTISMDIDYLENYGLLRVGTHGRGVWECQLYGSNSNVFTLQQGRTTLYTNYPNPFNPKTKINFEIGTAMNVSLKVYDILGREVVNLIDNTKLEKGMHSFELDASKYASGLYFYKLVTDNYVETKKMVLVK